MNYVDQNFNWLYKEIKEKSKDDIYTHIHKKYTLLPKETKKSIEKFLKDFPYWGKLNYEENEFEEIQNKTSSLKDHIEDYKWLYEHLQDYRSRKLLFAILYNWYDYNFSVLGEMMDPTYAHYYDLDILKCKNETFVDVGAYIGDTAIQFIQSYGKEAYKKIYCYEMTEESFDTLTKNMKEYPNIDFRQKAVSNQKGTLYVDKHRIDASANSLSTKGSQKIEVVTLDDDIKDSITLIKMDIEGAEKKAIEGCKKHIINDHPTLLLSVYHNHEDLWKIPKMIEDICPGYTFYLRFYGNNIFPTEIVLFCIYNKNN